MDYLTQDNKHTIMECILFFKLHGVIEEAVLNDHYIKTRYPMWNFEKHKYRPVLDKLVCPLCEGKLKSYHRKGVTERVCAKQCHGYAVVDTIKHDNS